MTSEVLTVVKILMLVSLVVTPCELVDTGTNISDKNAASMIGPVVTTEVVCLSELLISTYKSTWSYYPQDQ
jgi:hypothetical protein